MKKQFIDTGRIVGTHGVRGEVRVDPWCDDPQDLCTYKKFFGDAQGQQELKVSKARVHKRIVLMQIEGVHTIEQAERLRGTVIYVHRDELALPPGSYLVQDLLGCDVVNETGETFGKLTDVLPTGANDVWQVTKDGKDYLVPAVPEFVDSVDVDQGRVVLRPIKGIFDDEN